MNGERVEKNVGCSFGEWLVGFCWFLQLRKSQVIVPHFLMVVHSSSNKFLVPSHLAIIEQLIRQSDFKNIFDCGSIFILLNLLVPSHSGNVLVWERGKTHSNQPMGDCSFDECV